MKIKTVIADDHALFRHGMSQLLAELPVFELVGTAHNGREALDLALGVELDLLIIDHDMPGMSGLDIVNACKKAQVDFKIMVVTGITEEALVRDYLALEIDAMILKSDDIDEMKTALIKLSNGQNHLSASINELALRDLTAKQLTSRERQVLRHIVKGHSNKTISAMMGISAKTVDTHRSNLMRKLDIHNVAELVSFSIRSGLH